MNARGNHTKHSGEEASPEGSLRRPHPKGTRNPLTKFHLFCQRAKFPVHTRNGHGRSAAICQDQAKNQDTNQI